MRETDDERLRERERETAVIEGEAEIGSRDDEMADRARAINIPKYAGNALPYSFAHAPIKKVAHKYWIRTLFLSDWQLFFGLIKD